MLLISLQNLKKQTWLRQNKDVLYGILFSLSFFFTFNGGQAEAQTTSCTGWLCGPKNALVSAFPDGSAIINSGFIMMNGVLLAILLGMAVVIINRIANREDYSAPLATAFGTILVLLVVNYLAGYIFGSGSGAPTT